jgi:hypothetical protein
MRRAATLMHRTDAWYSKVEITEYSHRVGKSGPSPSGPRSLPEVSGNANEFEVSSFLDQATKPVKTGIETNEYRVTIAQCRVHGDRSRVSGASSSGIISGATKTPINDCLNPGPVNKVARVGSSIMDTVLGIGLMTQRIL